MPMRIDPGLLRAAWDFFVLFSGISTASNLSRTQQRPVRRRGLFLYRPDAPGKPNDPPGPSGKTDPPATPPVAPESQATLQPEFAGTARTTEPVVNVQFSPGSGVGNLRIVAGEPATDHSTAALLTQCGDQSLPHPFAWTGSFRREIRFPVKQAPSLPELSTPTPLCWRGPHEAAAAPQVPVPSFWRGEREAVAPPEVVVESEI